MEGKSMDFKKALDNIKNKQHRKNGLKAYYNDGQVYFSRLYGYNLKGECYEPIPQFANAIKLIFTMLNDGSSLPQIKKKLDSEGYKDSSNNKYCLSKIEALVRPVYAGYLQRGLGYTHIDNIVPIVTLTDYRKAKQAIQRESKKLTST
jgi:hypothetical protein